MQISQSMTEQLLKSEIVTMTKQKEKIEYQLRDFNNQIIGSSLGFNIDEDSEEY